MNASRALVSVCVVIGLLAGTAGAVVIATVPVGNAGNTGELSGVDAGGRGPDRICGAVGYNYRIGTYEITAGQYTEFLNAVAKTDTYGLFNAYMADPRYDGCNIQRSGSLGSYIYSVTDDWANRPVDYVSWGAAARFANWMRNGQPTGAQNLSTTEDGSYYLNGATSDAALMAVTRKANATWVIPSEDEWYKAAYYDPNKPDGAGYWDYPARSNTAPSNVLDPNGTDNANYYNGSYGGYTIGDPYYRTEVGAFADSPSAYGTFDQGGNVGEWNESVLHNGTDRDWRGGSFFSGYYFWDNDPLNASHRESGFGDCPPTLESDLVGFRVAYIPEPATLGLMALTGAGIIRRKRA